MKKLMFCGLLGLFFMPFLYSQIQVEIGSAKDINNLVTPENDIRVSDNDPRWNMWTFSRRYDYHVFRKHAIIVRLYDAAQKNLVTFDEVDSNLRIVLKAGNEQEIIELKDFPKDRKLTDFNIYFEDYFKNSNLAHNSEIEIWIESDKITFEKHTFEAKFQKKWSQYQSLGTKTGGFWFPTLQFSTNWESTPEGVPFASMPIGFAFGRKRNFDKFYVGGSVMANWLVYTQPEDANVDTDNSFNLQGLTIGTLVDIGDIVSIGYAYGMNFKSGQSDPGGMFVIGIGSEFIQFFKRDK